mmetsp:Transcript_20478/g.41901  ORF Transcript_20478/g.41901 Transcript_20478/m.41901 type:complete len:186 (-) Transcript_20478:168-725(-)|eukprot:CAMPEP_0119077268 /NCGR_PEP_ID=MMETSP1178-20130426/93859_1 /TAXON_ID=33656 /ORGANISM="unid sp, Strain CCMP2000" /LENGTH=185 /DNA_ID=CAMNT_0007059615 /DNA_START=50 /DNA_END=607 /DNA_ORIENTATION=+
MLALVSSSTAYSPTVTPRGVARAAAPQMGVEDMIGKYSVKGTVFDPLDLASKYDVNWMREAELKHGRICMLAVSGFLAVDSGIKFPGAAFEGISAIDAHDKMVESGHMWALLFIVGACELRHFFKVVPLLDTNWDGVEPGNYNLDPFNMDTPERRLSELKNGRLAMLGFSGLVTQAALGHPGYWA